MRIGMGYDIHRLIQGRKMVLGGVEIPFNKGPEGYSDGDALLHAISDAILGAMAKGDIGTHFPDTNPKYKNISSLKILEKVKDIMKKEGFRIGNLDCVVITEEPKLSAYRNKIVNLLSKTLEVSQNKIGLKGKTSEKLGVIGQGDAISAYAAVLLEEDL